MYLINQHVVPDVAALATQVSNGAWTTTFTPDASFGFGVPAAAPGVPAAALAVTAAAAQKLAAEVQAKAKAAWPKLALDGAFSP